MKTGYTLGWHRLRGDGTAKKGQIKIFFRYFWFAKFIASIIGLFGFECWPIITNRYTKGEIDRIKRKAGKR